MRDKIDSILTSNPAKTELNGLFKLQNLSTGISNDIILSGNFPKAISKLEEMVKICDETDEYSVYWPLSAAAIIGQLSFQLNAPRHLEEAREVIRDLSLRHPDYYPVKLIDAAFEIFSLNIRLFIKGESKYSLKYSFIQLDEKFKGVNIDFSKSQYDNFNDIVWGAYYILKLNCIDSEEDLNVIISEADAILKDYPTLVSVIQAKIKSITKLHKTIRHNLISREEVNDAYTHVLANVESESVRDVFEEMLENSTERNNKVNYLNHEIIANAIQTARFNPLNGSGIDEIDEMFGNYEDIPYPYQREMVKIGRNDPCPCRSGKKFKKCCMGKGIYD